MIAVAAPAAPPRAADSVAAQGRVIDSADGFRVLSSRERIEPENRMVRERLETLLNEWDCASCPRGVIHGYQNNTKETIFMQVMLGKSGKTELLGYADAKLFEGRDAHLKQA